MYRNGKWKYVLYFAGTEISQEHIHKQANNKTRIK